MPVIRSSDIGNYLYCHRAWWYRKKGYESTNQSEMASGTELHRRHGRKVMAASLLNYSGCFIIILALILLIVYLGSRV